MSEHVFLSKDYGYFVAGPPPNHGYTDKIIVNCGKCKKRFPIYRTWGYRGADGDHSNHFCPFCGHLAKVDSSTNSKELRRSEK